MWFILLVGLVLLPWSAESATYWAAPSGGGSCGNNSSGNPIGGLNNGANCLAAGDTLILKNGSYNECLENRIPSGISAAQPTIVKAENMRQARITHSGEGCNQAQIHIGLRAPCDFCGNQPGDVRHYITIDGLFFDMPTNVFVMAVKPQGGIEDEFIRRDGTTGLTLINNEVQGGENSGNVSDFSIGFSQTTNQYGWIVRNNYLHDIGMVAGPGPQNAWSYGMYVSGGDNLFENNEIARTSGFAFHGYSTHAMFNNNIFRNNYIHDTGGAILLACGGENNQIYNNIVARTGIGPANSANWGGIRLGTSCSGAQANNNFIYNNTLVNIHHNGWGCISLSASGLVNAANNVVRNNICWGSPDGDYIRNDSATAGTNTLDHNLCQGAGCALYSNPSFMTTIPDSDLASAGITALSFQLQSGSPAINTGVSTTSGTPTFTTDYGGNARIAGGIQDVGAWESGSGSLPAPTNLRLISITP